MVEQQVIMARDLDHDFIQWLRFPGHKERVEHDPEVEQMSECLYQVIYACHLAVAVARLQELFVQQHLHLEQQQLILARVPRGGLFATEILEHLLDSHSPVSLQFDREKIKAARAAYKLYKAHPEQEDIYQQFRATLADVIPVEIQQLLQALPLDQDHHLVMPEDIADSGNTLLLLIEACAHLLIAQGHQRLVVSILVPTASQQSLSADQGLVTRSQELAEWLCAEYQRPFTIELTMFTLYQEADSQYLIDLRSDKHDHGTTHESVRQDRALFEKIVTFLTQQVQEHSTLRQGIDASLLTQGLIQTLLSDLEIR